MKTAPGLGHSSLPTSGPSRSLEDGLTKAFSINSIPTTMIVDRNGEIVSRMNGFLPERFVDMLAERIEEALRP